MMRRVVLKAFAKINLTLDVLGLRPDNYHQVEMIMQGIDLYDLITIEKIDDPGIHLNCSCKELETKENLAYRAVQLLKEEFPQVEGIKISLQKAIPVAAGLAGGSTDAAGVLLGLNEIFALQLTGEQLQDFAGLLGSDIPFCLDPQTTLAQGRGEVLTKLPPCPELWMTLVKPPFGVSTKEVYTFFDNIKVLKRPNLESAVKALENKQKAELFSTMENVLEEATFQLYPQMKQWAEKLKAMGALKVLMSGSGPTLLAFTENEHQARQLAEQWNESNWKVLIARTIGLEDVKERMVVYDE